MPKKGQFKASATARSKAQRKFNSKPSEKKRRAARNKSRATAVKAGRVKKGDGKDVNHKDRNPKNNSRKNTSVQSKKTNRSHGGRVGNRAGKARGGRKSK